MTTLDDLAKRLDGIHFGVASVEDQVEQAKEVRDELDQWIREKEDWIEEHADEWEVDNDER